VDEDVVPPPAATPVDAVLGSVGGAALEPALVEVVRPGAWPPPERVPTRAATTTTSRTAVRPMAQRSRRSLSPRAGPRRAWTLTRGSSKESPSAAPKGSIDPSGPIDRVPPEGGGDVPAATTGFVCEFGRRSVARRCRVGEPDGLTGTAGASLVCVVRLVAPRVPAARSGVPATDPSAGRRLGGSGARVVRGSAGRVVRGSGPTRASRERRAASAMAASAWGLSSRSFCCLGLCARTIASEGTFSLRLGPPRPARHRGLLFPRVPVAPGRGTARTTISTFAPGKQHLNEPRRASTDSRRGWRTASEGQPRSVNCSWMVVSTPPGSGSKSAALLGDKGARAELPIEVGP